MMVSLGVGGMAAGIMHLLAHGFFKALLFLGSGSVIHASHHEQDIRRMGGLRRLMPVTFATYAIGMMALSGFPLLFSGAWTKEEILNAAHHWPVSQAPFYLMLGGVFLTALYMTRQMACVFYGDNRLAHGRPHESPPVMTIPLVVLAVCAVLFSIVLTPAWPWLDHYLNNESAQFDAHVFFQPIILLSLLVVGAGVGLGIRVYRNAGATDPLQESQPGVFRFLEHKMWIDELYEHTILAWAAAASRLADWMDRNVWDGGVRLVGGMAKCIGRMASNFDEGGINTGVDQGCDSTRELGNEMSAWHNGQVQLYLRVIGIGMLVLLVLYVWLA
jgi:NADH-quinone oxidoreductase subunit L